MSRILFVLTSHDHMASGDPTGLWLEEFAVPYQKLKAAGHEVTVASVAGGKVPVDPNSEPDADQRRTWQDAIAELADTAVFTDFSANEFDAVYLPGGHGTMFDMPDNDALHRLLLDFDRQGKIVSAVCHAPAVFCGLMREDGTPFVRGRRVAAFTDSEEDAVGGREKIPFLLETRLRELGAEHVPAEDWQAHAVRDGRLITGQNPQSSATVADRLIEALA